MMLAILYLVIVLVLGDLIGRRFYTFVSWPHRFASAFLVGALVSTWVSYGLAFLFRNTPDPMFWGNLLFFALAFSVIYLLWPRSETDPETDLGPTFKYEFQKWDWGVLGALALLVGWMMFSTLWMSDGKLMIAHQQWSDFGSNISIMQSFALGHNFPTEYPHYTGERIRYHFLFYFAAGNLEYLGFSPAFSNNILSIFSTVSLLILVMTLGAVLFSSRIVGRIGAALFFFHGSLSFIPYIISKGSISGFVTSLSTLRDFLPSGYPYRGELWGVWSQVVYLNQRHLASSIGLMLLVLVFAAIRYRSKFEEIMLPAAETPADEIEDPSEITDEPALVEVHEPPDDERSDSAQESTTEPAANLEAEPADEPLVEDTPETDDETEVETDGEPDEETGDELNDETDETDDEQKVEDSEEIAADNDEVPDEKEKASIFSGIAPFVFSGVILGLMPMWNGAVFLAAAVVFAILFLILPLRRQLIFTGIVAALTALPQVIYLRTGNMREAGYHLFTWGYTLENPSYWVAIKYLAFIFGLKWLLIAIAIYFGNRLQRSVLAAASSLILVTFYFQFSDEVLANHKFLNVWLVIANVFVGYGFVMIWQVRHKFAEVPARILAVILAIMIIFGGIIDLFPIRNGYWMELRFYDDQLVEWIKENTDKRAIFLSHRYVNHRILLAGRKLFYGHPYYSWSAGYATSDRDQLYKKMFQERDPAVVHRLLKENNISYVAVDDQLRKSDFIKNFNENIFQAYFELVYDDRESRYDKLKIYAVPAEMGDPDPTVELSPLPDPKQIDPKTFQNAFTGGEGHLPGQFSKPRGIAVDQKGFIYVADTGNSRVQKFDAEGNFQSFVGSPNPKDGGLREPNGIAIDAGGNIFVTDAMNGRLLKYSSDGKFQKEWKGPDPGFYGPRDIAFGPNKQLYIVDQGRGRIVRFDPAGETFTSWGTLGNGEGQFHESTGIAVGGGFVFVMDNGNNRIQVFDLNGTLMWLWEVPAWNRYVWHYPDAVYDDQRKQLIVTNGVNNELLSFDEQGVATELGIAVAGTAPLQNPSSIVIAEVNKKKQLLVLNTDGSGVARFPMESNATK